jgi:3D (Asp-Asp-Asp) domain-containing protein
VKTFKQFVLEKYIFGATAYGNADIDTTTANEIRKGILKPEWQYMGNKNNKLIAGYSIANNKLPHGTVVQIIDKRTGKPVGSEFGNTKGIYRVDDVGGSSVTNNIDFYAGSNVAMYKYFAKLGKNSNNLIVKPLNGKNVASKTSAWDDFRSNYNKNIPNDNNSEENDTLSKIEDIASRTYDDVKQQVYDLTGGDFSKEGMKKALSSVLNTAKGAIGKKYEDFMSKYER